MFFFYLKPHVRRAWNGENGAMKVVFQAKCLPIGYANGQLRFSTCAIASVRAIRGWCYYRCAAYLTALQSAAICWVACTCNIHPTVGSCRAVRAVLWNWPGHGNTSASLPAIVRVMLRGLTTSCYMPEAPPRAPRLSAVSQSIKLARASRLLCLCYVGRDINFRMPEFRTFGSKALGTLASSEYQSN